MKLEQFQAINNAKMLVVSEPRKLPPGVFSSDQNEPAGFDQVEVKPDLKDFFAITIAAYQVLLPPLLILIAGIGLVFLLLSTFFH